MVRPLMLPCTVESSEIQFWPSSEAWKLENVSLAFLLDCCYFFLLEGKVTSLSPLQIKLIWQQKGWLWNENIWKKKSYLFGPKLSMKKSLGFQHKLLFSKASRNRGLSVESRTVGKRIRKASVIGRKFVLWHFVSCETEISISKYERRP